MYILFDPVQSCIFFYFKTCCFKFEEKRFIRWSLSLFFKYFLGFFKFSRPIEFEKKKFAWRVLLEFYWTCKRDGRDTRPFIWDGQGGGVVFVWVQVMAGTGEKTQPGVSNWIKTSPVFWLAGRLQKYKKLHKWKEQFLRVRNIFH